MHSVSALGYVGGWLLVDEVVNQTVSFICWNSCVQLSV